MNSLPDALPKPLILKALEYLDAGLPHDFANSTRYDLLHDGRRYPPKAVVGVAAKMLTGQRFKPEDFSGGLSSKCFRLLEASGFQIVPKIDEFTLPGETFPEDLVITEGSVLQVMVNRYERNPFARAFCISHYGTACSICQFDFGVIYGELGEDFIHVHHLKPLSGIKGEYRVDPIEDLRPLCPNCHAMVHMRNPPYLIEEMQQIMASAKEANGTKASIEVPHQASP